MKTYEKYKDSGIDWIGEIPEHWESKRIRHIAEIFGRIGYRGYKVTDLVQKGEGAITISPSNMKDFHMDFSDCTYLSWDKYKESPEIMIQNEDILFVKTGSTYGKSSFVKDLPEKATINPQIIVLKNIECDNKLLWYIIKSENIQYQVEQTVVGGTIPTISQARINNYSFPIPPTKGEQTAIANYLDKKTAEIDQLIAEKEQLVKLYQEEKTALINQAVTKGINPDVKLKDSSIEWLGDIPKHWKIKRLKYIANVQTGRTPKIAGSKIDFFKNGTVNWYTPGDFIKGKHLGDSRRKLINEAFDQNQVELFEEHSTYLVSIGATLGKVSLCIEKASANQQINVITFDKESINPFYGYLFILGNSEMILNEADYTTLPILNQSKLNNISFAVPDKKEQTEIVEHIEKESTRIDKKIAKSKEYINLLTEYRTALISEVVTGKLKVID